MTDTTALHPVSTSLPDDLFERFEAERRAEDRNISQHLRTIVRRYYERADIEAKAIGHERLQVHTRLGGPSMTVPTNQAVHTDARGVVVPKDPS